jgi:hypothetical protein
MSIKYTSFTLTKVISNASCSNVKSESKNLQNMVQDAIIQEQEKCTGRHGELIKIRKALNLKSKKPMIF